MIMMNFNLNILNIWGDEGALSRSIIEDYAVKLGVVFPETYIELISQYDYLYLEDNIIDFINEYDEPDERDMVFCGYKTGVLDGSIIYNYSECEYGYGNQIVVFANCANGDYIGFDYRENPNQPSIVLMYHDDFYEDNLGNVYMKVQYLADDFDEFLAKLHS